MLILHGIAGTVLLVVAGIVRGLGWFAFGYEPSIKDAGWGVCIFAFWLVVSYFVSQIGEAQTIRDRRMVRIEMKLDSLAQALADGQGETEALLGKLAPEPEPRHVPRRLPLPQ